jgi:uncharacterized protein (TIGR02145 family)
MKKLIIKILLLIVSNNLFSQLNEVLKDTRDGKEYQTVKIGDQTWFAQNLAYKPKTGEYHAWADNESNVAKWGYLYDWATAKKVCPSGWHLPSDEDWKTLEITLGLPLEEYDLNNKRGEKLGVQLKSLQLWDNKGNGKNTSGFNAIPAGGMPFYDKSFNFLNEKAYFWTASANGTDAYGRVLSNDDNYFSRGLYSKNSCMSVRCAKNN